MAGYEEFQTGRSPEAKIGEAEMRENGIKADVGRPCWIGFGDDSVLHGLDGLRFADPYRQCAEEEMATQVYDVIKQRIVPAGGCYAVVKRQLSARALAQHGLQNDNRNDGGPAPQRHKGQKRKRIRS